MFIHLFYDQVEPGYHSHGPDVAGTTPPPPIETRVFLSFCHFIAWIGFVWTNWMFIFVSSVLIGGSHSLPLASWLTFGLSCILALLYRWWELPRAPSVCSVTDAAPAFALLPPFSVLFLLPYVCPALVVLLSFLHFIIPAWLNSKTRPLSVSLLLSLSLFYHNLTSSSSASKIFNIFNHVRVFDVSGKHPPPRPFLPFINIRAASPVSLRPGAAILGGPPVCSTDTATCRTPYQRRQRTCGNKMRNQKFQDKCRRRKALLLSNPSFETLGDNEWCKGERDQNKTDWVNNWGEGQETKTDTPVGLRQTSVWNICVHLSLYIMCNKV